MCKWGTLSWVLENKKKPKKDMVGKGGSQQNVFLSRHSYPGFISNVYLLISHSSRGSPLQMANLYLFLNSEYVLLHAVPATHWDSSSCQGLPRAPASVCNTWHPDLPDCFSSLRPRLVPKSHSHPHVIITAPVPTAFSSSPLAYIFTWQDIVCFH